MDDEQQWLLEAARKRNVVETTTKALNTLCDKISQGLAQSALQGKELENVACQAKARKMEAERELERHVGQLWELVQHYRQRQQERLTLHLRHHLEQVMVCKTEGLNHEARLTDLQNQAQEKLRVITEQNDVTEIDRNDVSALAKAFNFCAAPSLTPEITEGVTFTLKVPDAIADTIQTLVGSFVTSSDRVTTTPSQPDSAMTSRSFESLETLEKSSTSGFSPQASSEVKGSSEDTAPASSKKTKKKKAKKKPKSRQTNQDVINSVPAATYFPSPLHDITQSPPSTVFGRTTGLIGRGKVASGLAARVDGKVWVVYNSSDPHLDLVDKKGTVLQSWRIGGNAEHIAQYGAADVVVASNSPRMVTLFRTKDTDLEGKVLKDLSYKCTGLAVSKSGVAVSSSSTIYWMPWDSDQDQWIVSKDDSRLEEVSSLAAVEAQGKEFVCAADQGKAVVHVFRRSLRGRFVPLDPFQPPDQACFAPISVSGHPTGFLGVLDGISRRVYVVEVGNGSVMSTIDGYHLCDGVPTLLAFRPDADVHARPRLWVATAAGHLCVTRLNYDFELLS